MAIRTFKTKRTLWTVDTEAFTYVRTPLTENIHPGRDYENERAIEFDDAVVHTDYFGFKAVSFTGKDMYKMGLTSGTVVLEEGEEFEFENLYRPVPESERPTERLELTTLMTIKLLEDAEPQPVDRNRIIPE